MHTAKTFWLTLLALISFSNSISQMVVVINLRPSELKVLCNNSNELSTEIAVLRLLNQKHLTDERTQRILKTLVEYFSSVPWMMRIDWEAKSVKFRECILAIGTCHKTNKALTHLQTAPEIMTTRGASKPKGVQFRGTILIANPGMGRLVVYSSSNQKVWTQRSPRRAILSIHYCGIDEMVYWFFRYVCMVTKLEKNPFFGTIAWRKQGVRLDVRQLHCDSRSHWYFIATERSVFITSSVRGKVAREVVALPHAMALSRRRGYMYYIPENQGRASNYLFSKPYNGRAKRICTIQYVNSFLIRDGGDSEDWLLACNRSGAAFITELHGQHRTTVLHHQCIATAYDRDYKALVFDRTGAVTGYDAKDNTIVFKFRIKTNLNRGPVTMQVVHGN